MSAPSSPAPVEPVVQTNRIFDALGKSATFLIDTRETFENKIRDHILPITNKFSTIAEKVYRSTFEIFALFLTFTKHLSPIGYAFWAARIVYAVSPYIKTTLKLDNSNTDDPRQEVQKRFQDLNKRVLPAVCAALAIDALLGGIKFSLAHTVLCSYISYNLFNRIDKAN